jgi:hypothetical protein
MQPLSAEAGRDAPTHTYNDGLVEKPDTRQALHIFPALMLESGALHSADSHWFNSLRVAILQTKQYTAARETCEMNKFNAGKPN